MKTSNDSFINDTLVNMMQILKGLYKIISIKLALMQFNFQSETDIKLRQISKFDEKMNRKPMSL